MLEDQDEEALLVEFIRNYSVGPACLVVNCNEIHKPIAFRAYNTALTSKHTASLQQLAILGRLSSHRTGSTAGVHWSFTQLRNNKVVCIGTSQDSRQRDSLDGGRPQPAKTDSNGSESADGAAWFEIWESLQIPELDRANSEAHLQLLRNIDFSKTALGAIDTWCPELLTAFTQCLGSPSPVMILWGREENICAI